MYALKKAGKIRQQAGRVGVSSVICIGLKAGITGKWRQGWKWATDFDSQSRLSGDYRITVFCHEALLALKLYSLTSIELCFF